MPLISLVVPCYNEEDSIPLFQEEVERVFAEMNSIDSLDSAFEEHGSIRFEVIYVDDGSRDRTLDILQSLASRPPIPGMQIRYISFSRNFGKEAALIAGLDESRGDYVATMDADMQDPPSLLPEMYGLLISSGADNVATRRVSRKGEPPIRSFFARMFYKIINRLSETEIVDGARDYRLMTRQMVDAICSMREISRFSKGIFGWVGFKTEWIEFENVERVRGETKWNIFSLFSYSIDGIVAFSTKPLHIASIGGMVFCVFAFLLLVVIVARTLLFGDPVAGWPSLACLVLFVGGIQMLCMGVFGQYLSKSYLEMKGRPLYLIRESGQQPAPHSGQDVYARIDSTGFGE